MPQIEAQDEFEFKEYELVLYSRIRECVHDMNRAMILIDRSLFDKSVITLRSHVNNLVDFINRDV